MEEHVKILAILNIVLGGLGVLGALIILVVFGGLAGLVAANHDPDAGVGVAALGAIGGIAFLIVFVLSVPCVIGGIGLLKFRPWAQTLTIVMSILNLIHVPFGTALGIYGLWVLLNDQTKSLFRARATA